MKEILDRRLQLDDKLQSLNIPVHRDEGCHQYQHRVEGKDRYLFAAWLAAFDVLGQLHVSDRINRIDGIDVQKPEAKHLADPVDPVDKDFWVDRIYWIFGV